MSTVHFILSLLVILPFVSFIARGVTSFVFHSYVEHVRFHSCNVGVLLLICRRAVDIVVVVVNNVNGILASFELSLGLVVLTLAAD